MQADAAHTTRVKLRKGVEAAGGRIIENDRYVSGDYAEEIYCDKRRANRSWSFVVVSSHARYY